MNPLKGPVTHLFHEKDAVDLFTGVENERALCAYAKAGFQVKSQTMDAEHGWSTVLMTELR